MRLEGGNEAKIWLEKLREEEELECGVGYHTLDEFMKKSRNPIARVLRRHRHQVIPDKREKIKEKIDGCEITGRVEQEDCETTVVEASASVLEEGREQTSTQNHEQGGE